MDYKLHKKRLLKHILVAPFIYILIIPLVFLDIMAGIYHHVGFRLCGIPLVKRSEFIRIDRHKLKYLNLWEKMNCAYCGYANGLAAYFVELAAKTEKYWCGIKHQKTKDFREQPHHKGFPDYGDEKGFRRMYKISEKNSKK